MSGRLLILGQGYSGGYIAAEARAAGFAVTGVKRQAGPQNLAFDDPAVAQAIAEATHILSSVPPGADGADPVLARFGTIIAGSSARWIGYLSSTGVYGDAGGAWVDEATPVGRGRRTARTQADLDWQALGPGRVHVFRLPGIYGPGRSALDRVRAGDARRIDRPGHAFGRIHVEDIAGAVVTAMQADRPGVYNIADQLPAEPRHVTEYACDLLRRPWPPLEPLDLAALSPMARGFWSEHRRVAATKLARDLGHVLRYPTYREGLRACLAVEDER